MNFGLPQSTFKFSRYWYRYQSVKSYFRVVFRSLLFWKRFPIVNSCTARLQPLFIIGSGRSGNTLLRAMLSAHGDIAIPPESYVLGGLVDEYQNFNHLHWPMVVRLLLSKFEGHSGFAHWNMDLRPVYAKAVDLPGESRNLAGVIDLLYQEYALQKQPQALRWGDKTPLNTLRLENIYLAFPNAYYLHILRDGRDAVLSYIKTGIYTNMEDAANRWLTSVEKVRLLQNVLPVPQFLEVRYEDIVTTPDNSMRAICSFLSIEYKPSMLEFWKLGDRLGDTILEHHANVRNPLNRSSIGKWKKELTTDQQAQIQKLLGKKLTQTGYND